MNAASDIHVEVRPETPTSPWPIFFVASIAVFLVSIDGTGLFAAFDALRSGFPHSRPADLSWVINAYTVVYASVLVPAGGLADALGMLALFVVWARRTSQPGGGPGAARLERGGRRPSATRPPGSAWAVR